MQKKRRRASSSVIPPWPPKSMWQRACQGSRWIPNAGSAVSSYPSSLFSPSFPIMFSFLTSYISYCNIKRKTIQKKKTISGLFESGNRDLLQSNPLESESFLLHFLLELCAYIPVCGRCISPALNSSVFYIINTPRTPMSKIKSTHKIHKEYRLCFSGGYGDRSLCVRLALSIKYHCLWDCAILTT